MIYTKEANFPFPVLSSHSDSYYLNYFKIDVSVSDDSDYYFFNFTYEIDSSFINGLITETQAELVLVIQTIDSIFFKVKPGMNHVKIKKNRVSLNKKTSIQMHIHSIADIIFYNNEDLNPFYSSIKEKIEVPRHRTLGYSNIVRFHGNIKKPYELFSKNLDENLTSEIKIELGLETIIVHYKKREYQFNHLMYANALNNAYIYTGLTKALFAFIIQNGSDGVVELDEIDEPEGLLDIKLYNLMKSKQVVELTTDNIDKVIHKISDSIIEKFTSAVGRIQDERA